MKKLVRQRLFFLAVCFLALQTAYSQNVYSQTARSPTEHLEAMDHSWEVHAEVSSSNTQTLLGERGTGFRTGATWKPDPAFGLVTDFEFQPGSRSFTSAMGGPRFYSGEHYRLSGFLQALGGGYRAKASSVTGAAWHYRWGGGGGVDIRITHNVVFRLFEYDLTFIGADSGPLLCARGASGLVFRFGRR